MKKKVNVVRNAIVGDKFQKQLCEALLKGYTIGYFILDYGEEKRYRPFTFKVDREVLNVKKLAPKVRRLERFQIAIWKAQGMDFISGLCKRLWIYRVGYRKFKRQKPEKFI